MPPTIYFGTPLVTSHDSVQILKLVYLTLYYQMRVAIYFSSEILFKALSDCSRASKVLLQSNSGYTRSQGCKLFGARESKFSRVFVQS